MIQKKKSIIIVLCVFVIGFVVISSINFFQNKYSKEESLVEGLIQSYKEEPTTKKLVVLCDALAQNKDIRIVEYVEDAVSIDNTVLEETLRETYAEHGRLKTINSLENIEEYKLIWLTSALTICSNENNVENFEDVLISCLPKISNELRTIAIVAGYKEYNKDFVLNNKDSLYKCLNSLYENSATDIEKQNYLIILSSLYEVNGNSEKSDELLQELDKILGDTNNDNTKLLTRYFVERENWKILFTYLSTGVVLYDDFLTEETIETTTQ